MSILQTVSPTDCKGRLKILRIPPDALVQILGSPEHRLHIWMHWTDAGCSYPCLGRECQICHLPAFQYGYIPVAKMTMSSVGKMTWSPAILPCTESICDLCSKDMATALLAVKRTRQGNSPMVYSVVRTIEINPLPGFDVAPHLLRRWGLRADGSRLDTRRQAKHSDAAPVERAAPGSCDHEARGQVGD